MTLRLILNADDYGYDPAVSRGIAEAMRRGVVSSTTMIVNSPHTEAAASDAAGLSIGLHVNMVRFHAVSDPRRELDESTQLDVDFVTRETRAQLDRLELLLGRKATHLDVHKHWHVNPHVLEGICRVARERSLALRSIDEPMRSKIRSFGVRTNDAFLGDAAIDPYWTETKWAEHLASVPRDGVVELMCHPGYTPSHLKSGYGAQREVELATFCAPAAREALKREALELASWNGA